MTSPAPTTTALADARIPAAHPFAAHLRRTAALEAEQPHRPWTPEDGPLPSLYLSHGGGPLPFQSPEWLDPLHDWARALPKPKAILVVSAHWESAPLSVSAARPSELVYDFGGFDALYHTFRYDTPDAGDLARQVVGLMPDTEQVHQHARPGLDHGAWVPLKIMYPAADVPVLQLSLPTEDPDELLALGERLRPLRGLEGGDAPQVRGVRVRSRDAGVGDGGRGGGGRHGHPDSSMVAGGVERTPGQAPTGWTARRRPVSRWSTLKRPAQRTASSRAAAPSPRTSS